MNRAILAKILTADVDKFVFWTHKSIPDLEGHEEVIPQHIEKCEWDDMEAESDISGNFILHIALGGVPADHKAFTIRYEGEVLWTDVLYGGKQFGPRFYDLVVDVFSERGEYFENPRR